MKYGTFLLMTAMLTLAGEAMAQTDNVVALLPDGVQANVNPERKQDKAKNLVVAGSPEKGYKAFFAATDNANGEELWVTDGTKEGTHLVKDIVPGVGSSNPSNLGRLNDKVLFAAYTDLDEVQVWVSDGTEAGTKQLTENIVPGTGASPVAFTQMNETQAIFAAYDEESAEYDPDRGPQRWLWVTDGTVEGTRRVKAVDLKWPGQDNTTLHTAYVRSGRRVFFKADDIDGTTGEELWVTDGTENGTYLVMDINWERWPEGEWGYAEGFTRSSAIDNLENYKNEGVVFKCWTPDFGNEPWYSDGTKAENANGPGGDGDDHTFLVKDTNPGKDENGIGFGGNPFGYGFEVYKDKIWYRAFSPDGGQEFGGYGNKRGDWVYYDVWQEEPSWDHNSYSDPGCVFDGVYMFCAAHGFDAAIDTHIGGEMWYFDGEKVQLQMDFVPGNGCDWIKEQTVAGGSMYWWNEVSAPAVGAYTGALYRLDSKEATPVVVTHLDETGDFCHSLRNLNGTIIFASDKTHQIYVDNYTKEGWDGVSDFGHIEPEFGNFDSITEVREAEASNNGIYNLNGMRVSGKLQKGVYIVNGKKVVVR